jgi:hypothetical protein
VRLTESFSIEIRLTPDFKKQVRKTEDIAPLEPFKTYDLPTPYNSFGAGAILMKSIASRRDRELS